MLLNVPIATWVLAGVLLAVVYILMSMRRLGPSEIEGTSKFVPDVLVTSGSNGGGALDGLAATAMRYLAGAGGNGIPGEAKGGSLPSCTAGKSDQD